MKVATYKTMLNADRHNTLIKESEIDYGTPAQEDTFTDPESIRDLVCRCFELDQMAEEYVYMLSFDCKGHLLGVFEVSHGTNNGSLVVPREIYIRALLCGASTVALVHNHPSGDPEPSQEDIRATKRVGEAGKLIGIPLIDHIVVGSEGKYCSLREIGEI